MGSCLSFSHPRFVPSGRRHVPGIDAGLILVSPLALVKNGGATLGRTAGVETIWSVLPRTGCGVNDP